MSTFASKHVLITGGASGIGFLMGKAALQHKAQKLIIWDIDEEKMLEAKGRFNELSDKVYTYHVDVSDSSQIYQTADKTLQDHGHIDILINNAGIVVGKPFARHTIEEIESTLAINLEGVMHTARAFLPGMLERDEGHIVNIASAVGHMPNPNMSVYAASKWGVIGWSESLRVELAQQNSDVRVTSIEPSYIDTGMFAGVKAPLLTPFLDAEDISSRIIRAVQKNKLHLRAPFLVKILPFLKGTLPKRVFDFVAGKLFHIYDSMDTFKGRTAEIE